MHGLGLVLEGSKSHYYVANQWLPCYLLALPNAHSRLRLVV